MAKFVLQPASTGAAVRHYENTIENPRSLSELEGMISPNALQRLEEIYQGRRIPIWGAVEGNRSTFSRMERGDRVLFYKDQEFISKGRVTLLLPDSDRLANHLWDPDPDSGPYRHVFFLDDIQPTRVPWGPVRDHLGYKSNYYLQRLTVLNEDKSDSLLKVISEYDLTLGARDEEERDPVEDSGAKAAEEALETGQGFASSAEVRAALEDHSMERAEQFFRRLDFDVDDVSPTHPYDLRCEQGDLTLHVEVKGTQTTGDRVILTANEVAFAREHADRMVLFVVHSIEVTEYGNGEVETSGGTRQVLMPWDVDEGELAAINYRYSVPEP